MDVSVRKLSCLFAMVAALAGCQMPNPSIELLESELRWMEDQLFVLDRQLDQTCLQLASAQNSNRALQRELARLQPSADATTAEPRAAGPERTDEPRPAESLVPPGVEVPEANELDQEDLQVPEIDLGPGIDAPSIPGQSQPAPSTSPPLLDESLDNNLDDFTQVPDTETPIARIALNTRLTGGYDFDGHPGDEGILVVIEPQDSTGQYVPRPGDVLIEVRDARRSATAARVARWEFESDETVAFFKQSLLGRGMHLKLPWPAGVPDTERLLLTVRYSLPAHAPLTAERPIRIDLIDGQDPTRVAQQPSTLPVDPFLPTSPPQWHQLLPDQAFSMPTGPLDERELRSGEEITAGRPRANRQARRSTSPRTRGDGLPQWSPYR